MSLSGSEPLGSGPSHVGSHKLAHQGLVRCIPMGGALALLIVVIWGDFEPRPHPSGDNLSLWDWEQA